jgi:tetratricopeptide (TPR) repeat protein
MVCDPGFMLTKTDKNTIQQQAGDQNRSIQTGGDKMNTLKIFAGVLLLSTAFFGYSLYASTATEPDANERKAEIDVLLSKSYDTSSLVLASNEQNSEVKVLLQNAEEAYWKVHLTTPAHDNAYTYYQRVLAIQPENVAARIGVQRITDKYIELADHASQSGRVNSAKGHLQKALMVNPDSVQAKDMLANLDRMKVVSRDYTPGYSTLSSAKEAYRTGRISKPEYQQIVRRLKTVRDDKIRNLKLSYKYGEIDKITYSQKVRQVKTRYQ